MGRVIQTKKNAVNEILKEYIMKRKQKDILSLFGKVDMEPSYDYKKERKSKEKIIKRLSP